MKTRPAFVAAGVALLAAFCALILPFFFPGHAPVYSATYPVGAENRVATISLALLSVAVALWASRRPRTANTPETQPISQAALLTGATLVALWTIALGWAIAHAGVRYGESTYFLERMRDALQFGGHLYSQLEFPYGPLLLYPAVWLAHALGVNAAYFTTLTLFNVFGVLMAAYVLNRLPLQTTLRYALFAAFCFEQLNPLAGPNYSLGKFMLPFAALLWGIARRTPMQRALALAAGHLLVVLVSPELGVGMAAAIVGWALLTWWQTRQPAVLLACLAPVLGYGLFFALFGRGFLDRLGHAAGGALNLILEPLPHLLIFLVAVVWLAPIAVGMAQRGHAETAATAPAEGPALAAIWLLSLGLLPGALGRCDPLHVFFNGFGFLLLSFVAIRRHSRRTQLVWTAAVALLCLQVQVTNFAIYRPALKALASAARSAAPRLPFETAQLSAQTNGAPIATPALLTLPLADELALRHDGQFVEDKYPGLAEIWTPTDEQAKIARLRQSSWALLPAASYTEAEGDDNTSRVKRLFRLGYRYKQRFPPYVVGLLLQRELATNWTPAGTFGDAILYHRLR